MADPFATGLAVLDRAFGKTVIYNGAGLVDASVVAIFSSAAGEAFRGPGNTIRQVSFEIDQALLPERPRVGNTIVRAGVTWKVGEVTDLDDIGRWLLVVKR